MDVLLFDYRHQLCSEVLAVKPPLEQDTSGVVYVVPESTSKRYSNAAWNCCIYICFVTFTSNLVDYLDRVYFVDTK